MSVCAILMEASSRNAMYVVFALASMATKGNFVRNAMSIMGLRSIYPQSILTAKDAKPARFAGMMNTRLHPALLLKIESADQKPAWTRTVLRLKLLAQATLS
jgi:hypothetical protein